MILISVRQISETHLRASVACHATISQNKSDQTNSIVSTVFINSAFIQHLVWTHRDITHWFVDYFYKASGHYLASFEPEVTMFG